MLLVPEDTGPPLFSLILTVPLAQVSSSRKGEGRVRGDECRSRNLGFLWGPTHTLVLITLSPREGVCSGCTHVFEGGDGPCAIRHWLTLVFLDPDYPSGLDVQQQRGRGESKR